MEARFFPWYLTALVYLTGTIVYRIHKASGWCSEQDIASRKAGKPPFPTFQAGYKAYWSEMKYIIVYDFISQCAVGFAWASGMITAVLEEFGVTVPEKPGAALWYPLVFTVAFSVSGFVSERLKNRYLKKVAEG